jgi:hypothetical protein
VHPTRRVELRHRGVDDRIPRAAVAPRGVRRFVLELRDRSRSDERFARDARNVRQQLLVEVAPDLGDPTSSRTKAQTTRSLASAARISAVWSSRRRSRRSQTIETG